MELLSPQGHTRSRSASTSTTVSTAAASEASQIESQLSVSETQNPEDTEEHEVPKEEEEEVAEEEKVEEEEEEQELEFEREGSVEIGASPPSTTLSEGQVPLKKRKIIEDSPKPKPKRTFHRSMFVDKEAEEVGGYISEDIFDTEREEVELENITPSKKRKVGLSSQAKRRVSEAEAKLTKGKLNFFEIIFLFVN